MRLASGVDDSPIAKRGCFPFSSTVTERPSRRAIMAMSEPAKPEPITAMSHALCTRRVKREMVPSFNVSTLLVQPFDKGLCEVDLFFNSGVRKSEEEDHGNDSVRRRHWRRSYTACSRI